MSTDRTSFDAVFFLEALSTWVGVGRMLAAPWLLDEISQASDGALRLTLSDDADRAFDVLVTSRDDARPAYARSPNLDIVYLRSGDDDPLVSHPGAKTALALLCLAIIKADPPERRWGLNRPVGEDRLPASRGDGELTLSIPAACGARCIFCGQLELSPPQERFDDVDHQRWLDRLRQGRDRGISALRLTGLDPLAYPRALELISAAVEMGFGQVAVSTFGPLLVDRGLVDELAATLPSRRRLDLSLQGDNAELHDRITRSPGSWAAVTRALEHLSACFEPEAIRVQAVILRQNLSALGGVRELVRSFGFGFGAQLPFPNRGGRRDPYRHVAPRISEAVATLHALTPPLLVKEAPPCVLLRHEGASGVPSFTKLVPCQAPLSGRGDARRAGALGGAARAAFEPPTVRCPWVEGCGLAGRCQQMVYRDYAELYGLDELEPSPR